MTETNPPGWLQNGGDTHTAAQLRTYLAALQAGTFSAATNLRARGGISPGLGAEFNVTQTGSPSMAVLVGTGVASIPGTLAGTQGNYLACNDATKTVAVTTAHATLARIDIVVFTIRDSFYAGSDDDSLIQVIAGTPAGSPVAPSAPENSIIIAQIAVAALATTIVNANITDVRFYMAASGGVINARTDATRPTTSEIGEGQLVYAMDNDRLYLHNGTAYQRIWPGADTLFVRKTADETINNVGALQNDDVLLFAAEANLVYLWEIRAVINSGTTPDFQWDINVPAGAVASYDISLSGGSPSGPFLNAVTLAVSTTGSDQSLLLRGILVMSATPGNLTFRWSQQVATASNTIVRANSWIRANRMP